MSSLSRYGAPEKETADLWIHRLRHILVLLIGGREMDMDTSLRTSLQMVSDPFR